MKIKYFKILKIFLIIFAFGVEVEGARQNQNLVQEAEQKAAELVQLQAAGDYQGASQLFDRILLQTLPPEKVKEVWENLLGLAGPYRGQIRRESEVKETYFIVLVTCEFEHKNINIKVVLDRSRKITGFWYLPDTRQKSTSWSYAAPPYAAPDRFVEREVLLGETPGQLPGVLCLPGEVDLSPAVVLIHDIGPYDRDETIGPNKPFRDIAWGLASRKVAALRFDKRTWARKDKSDSQIQGMTVDTEIINDVLTALALLRRHEKIDPRKIFLLGHGLGGMLLPRIEKADSDIAGSIVLAGMFRSLEDVLYREKNYVFSLDGEISGSEKAALDKLRQQITLVKEPRLSERRNVSELPLGLPLTYWLDIRQYNPGAVAQKLSKPMLILQGGRDYQVTLDDYQAWRRQLTARENVQFKLYLRLNHLFMPGEGTGKSTPAEYQLPDHVDANVIEDIAEWIQRRSSGVDVR